MTNVVAFGDSEIAGALVTDTARIYHAWLTAYWRGETISNLAISGSRMADVADRVYAYAVQPVDRFEIQVGFNDVSAYGVGGAALATFSDGLKAMAYWLTGSKLTSRAAGWTFTGAWSLTPGYGIGKYTTAAGATAAVAFSGDVMLMGIIVASGAGVAGRFQVSIDGVNKGTFTCVAASSTQRSFDSSSYAPALLRIPGCGAGSHTVVITALDAGKLVFLDWIDRGSNGQLCSLLSLPKPTAGYQNGLWTATSADAMNGAVAAVASAAVADGRNVQFIDINANDDPNTNRVSSGDHPNNLGGVQWTKTKLAALPASLL